MEKMVLYTLLFVSFLSVVKYFENKLYMLICLESLMLISLKSLMENSFLKSFSSAIMIFFMTMMVVDSTFGISTLMSTSRSSMTMNKHLNSF